MTVYTKFCMENSKAFIKLIQLKLKVKIPGQLKNVQLTERRPHCRHLLNILFARKNSFFSVCSLVVVQRWTRKTIKYKTTLYLPVLTV
jgi:hypothetical protein